ncbi:L,D-transpeptidase-like protein [Archangium gephyra]|uniref:Inner membrane protein n=1 Tax=Archangium gephyra TaxID=48 RepID=A0AAC8Q0F1_9BACT|nr:L,D-transpeptidase family protein [Archangium gephyra]AKI98708.1 Putative inner membrane protein [Archangium gephyra]REG30635.1 L,D-transpeptidase-like protein [Archangium gephyra]
MTRLLLLLGVLAALPAWAQDKKVEAVRRAREHELAKLFTRAGVSWPPEELYVRAFKQERELEVWAGARGERLRKVKTFPFCAASGDVGPKRREGDEQVPEGFYTLDQFNPRSQFHLSMRVSYPNEADRRLGERPLGGAIYVHGNCMSIGCIAIQDGPIEELYLMVLAARGKMKRDVPIHIFPRRLDARGLAALEKHPRATPRLVTFWRGLEPGWRLFEETRRPPRVSVDTKTGAYTVRPGR